MCLLYVQVTPYRLTVAFCTHLALVVKLIYLILARMGVEAQILCFRYSISCALKATLEATACYTSITITRIGNKIDTGKDSIKNLIPQSLVYHNG